MRFKKLLTALLLLSLPVWAFAAFSNGSDRLLSSEFMTSNQYLQSSDGRFRFYLQSDGNLVLRVVSSGQSLWSSATQGQGGTRLNMQSDGNLVLRNSAGAARWASATNGLGANRASLQSDGNFVLYTAANAAVWATNTPQAPSDTIRPVITRTGNATMALVQGSSFVDPGATATDNIDGNITNRIVKTGTVNTAVVGNYTLRYDVSDNAGNAAISVTRAVTVTAALDTIPPVITLNGSAVMSLVQGASFADPGATATDNVDGNITARIVKTGAVNTAVVASYTLRYDVSDNAGNAAISVTRSVTVTAVNVPPGNSDRIALPIEVLGPAATKKEVSFNLNDLAQISHLYLRCNACGYDDIALNKNTSRVKASVRINGGTAIALKRFTEGANVYGNTQIKVIGGEANYGGIGGAFRTVRFTVPVSGLRLGSNSISFEHVNAEAPSLGFRIIEMNLLKNGDLNQKVWNAANFVLDDPRTWAPPRNTANDIAQGAGLWAKRNALYDSWLDNLDGAGNSQGSVSGRMQAACSDCHLADGRDLKYFNFSNTSIIERAKFHRLSQTEGEQIASYIRSRSIPVVPGARPWNPTYQPGPNLDSKSVYEWAAGAGIDAVLDRDSDIAPYLFPQGTSLAQVRSVVDRYKTLNLRELPINIPLPEWNQWLPIIHPDDAFDTTKAAINADNRGVNVGMPYYKKLLNDAMENPSPSNLAGFSADLKEWLRRDLNCLSNGPGDGEPMRALNGAVLATLRLPSPSVTSSNCTSINRATLKNLEFAKRGLASWASVKLWQVIHSKGLEQESQNMGRSVCSNGSCINASETRGWVADGRNLFDRPPHFTGVDPARRYLTQNELQGIFESNTWYHLNMIVNPGYRVAMPSHFAYTYSHIELLQDESQVDQGYRFWATLIKQRQLQTNGRYGVETGLDLRTAQPYIYYGTARDRTKTDVQSSVGQPLWGRLAQAMVEDFVKDANNATAQNWADATRNSEVQDRNSTNFSACSGVCTFDLGAYQGRNTYRVIPKLREIGVEEGAIRDLVAWGRKTWPNGPWNNL